MFTFWNFKKIGSIYIILISIACQTENRNHNHSREFLPDPEKYEHDNYSPNTIIFSPDISINSISLFSYANIETYLGKDILKSLSDSAISPIITILSKDKKQSLLIYLHPGKTKFQFSEFEINYVKDKDRKRRVQAADNEFKTESGIKLGITMGQLKSIKGEPHMVLKKDNYQVLGYQIDDLKNSEFLKKYGMKEYYSDYSFINGYLEKIKFGFK